MKKIRSKFTKRDLMVVGLLIFLLVALIFMLTANKSIAPGSSQSTPVNSISSNNQPTVQAPVAPTKVATVTYPIDQFSARLTGNFFGTYFPSGQGSNFDTQVCQNATYYVGYHTGDDLETFPSELSSVVSVVSIADGTVRQVGPVTGYGGLIVVDYILNNLSYTAYFGHVNLATATVKAGDHVVMGQKLVELGSQCSQTNGNVRKHLHFALHKGTAVDVRGYAPDQTTLANWVDPKTLFTSLGL